MKIALDNGGSYLEPDEEPRASHFHMRIAKTEKIPGYRNAHRVTLGCGHVVQMFGDLGLAQGRVLCTKCRDLEL